MKFENKILVYRILILSIFFLLWESLSSYSKKYNFLYGSPSEIFNLFIELLFQGELLYHIGVTSFEVIVGFIIGNILGFLLGIFFWYFDKIYLIVKPFIIVVGSVPLFALAPLMIIWFGVGTYSKIILVVISVFIMTLTKVVKGSEEISRDKLNLMKSFSSSKVDILIHLILPSSISWIGSAFKVNVNLALIGAFIGEFISSEYGLGHFIMVSSGLYDISSVFLGIILITLLALFLTNILEIIERKVKAWERS